MTGCAGCRDTSPLCFQCCVQKFVPILASFYVGVVALTMINLFEGMNYWTSFENVLLEREWLFWYRNLDAESVFRAITAFLG